MNSQRNPKWWNTEHESSWERLKAAFKRDWDQTKHDFGGHEPDTKQGLGDTVRQASGKETIPPRGQPNYEETEDAYRFGFAAHSQYRQRFSTWDDRLESQLMQDWKETYNDRDWARYRDSIRRWLDHDEAQGFRKAA